MVECRYHDVVMQSEPAPSARGSKCAMQCVLLGGKCCTFATLPLGPVGAPFGRIMCPAFALRSGLGRDVSMCMLTRESLCMAAK